MSCFFIQMTVVIEKRILERLRYENRYVSITFNYMLLIGNAWKEVGKRANYKTSSELSDQWCI